MNETMKLSSFFVFFAFKVDRFDIMQKGIKLMLTLIPPSFTKDDPEITLIQD